MQGDFSAAPLGQHFSVRLAEVPIFAALDSRSIMGSDTEELEYLAQPWAVNHVRIGAL